MIISSKLSKEQEDLLVDNAEEENKSNWLEDFWHKGYKSFLLHAQDLDGGRTQANY